MAQKIRVTPGQLESAATKIENLASDYKSQYESLYRTTDNLASTWQGKDNKAFVEKINEFKKDFEKMHSCMLDYVDVLRKIANAYQTTQDNITSEARSIQNY